MLRGLGFLVALAGIGFGAAAADPIILAKTHPATEPLFGDQVAPTVGAALMCGSQLPNDVFCKGVKQYRPLALDQRTLNLIQSVNKQVNADIEPVDDIVQWGVPEKW